jgi:serine phosphatase RsbU (regulator of sigma subunit)
VGLAAGAGFLGVSSTVGLGLLGGAVAYLGLDALVIQPGIDRRQTSGDGLAAAARAILQRARNTRNVAVKALALDAVARNPLGIERTLLLVPAPEGGVRVLGGDGSEAAQVGEAEQAFMWLGERGEPVDQPLLAQLSEFEGARAAGELMKRLGADVLLPLRHRGMLLGVAALSAPARAPETLGNFYRILGAHATVAIANTYLDVEARGKKSLSKALDLATAIQEALMPDDRAVKRSGVAIRGLFRPVAECGGDLWTWQDLGSGKILLLIGDATGHGAAPAMLTAVAKGGVDALRLVLAETLDPAKLLAELNRAIYRAGRTRYLMTAFAAVIDAARGEIQFANAGQNFPYLITKGDHGRPKLEALVARGNSLGAAPDAPYTTVTRRLDPGDKLVLYTDGVIDAGSPAFEPFGEKRFRAALVALAETPAARLAEGLLAEVDAYLGGRPFADDMTLVVAEALAPEGAEA